LTTTLAGVTAILGLGSLIFVGIQVRRGATETRHAALAEEAERLRQRKRETINAVAATAKYRQEMKSALPWNDRDAATVKAFLAEAENDDKARHAVRAYLDYVEMLAAGVNEGVFDLSTLARMQGGRIVAIAANYSDYIDRRRGELNSPTLYSELTALAEEISRTRQQPGSSRLLLQAAGPG
jgi:hypothetical protein